MTERRNADPPSPPVGITATEDAALLLVTEPAPPALLPFVHPHVTFAGLARKRAFDLVGAALLMVATLPLWLAIALAIRLDGPGAVLFRQERVGARPRRVAGRIHWQRTSFRVVKFRTMVPDADPTLHVSAIKAFASGERPPLSTDPDAPFKLTDDPRVTRVGRWLRRTSLDELPQLINVLGGSMSLVGPRPLPDYEVAEYQPWHYERLCAWPGITGLWQIEGRGTVTFDHGTRLDIEYVRRRSLLYDLRILLRTVPAVLSTRGAR